MVKLCTFAGATVFGYAFYAVAEPLGFAWAFLISGIGSIVGVYAGWKLARKLEE